MDYRALQQRLNDLGASPPLVVDGTYGPKSRAAVIQFQQRSGLVADGVVGPKTLAALGLGGSPAPAPEPTVPPGELPDRMTPLSSSEAAQAFSDGYLSVTGKRPSKQVLALLIAQSALETGNWKSMHNFNFGNKKASDGDRNWQYFRCSEILDGVEQFFDPPDPHCKFAAYANKTDGAAAYVRLLQSRPNWWNGLQSGTPQGFVNGLSRQPFAYFTADPASYARTVSALFTQYASLAEQYAGRAVGIGLVALAGGLGYLGYRLFRAMVLRA